MREPRFAGILYAQGEKSLFDQLTTCFEHEKGPGATPAQNTSQRTASTPRAILAPFGSYDEVGPCAAWSYKSLGEAPLADVYVIISASTSGLSGLTQEPFTTPLGIVRVDQDLARKLLGQGSIADAPRAFDNEPGIEAQLPFIQFINNAVKEKVKVLPLLVNEKTDLHQLSLDLKELLVDTHKRAVFIVSTNLTHYGRDYQFAPFSDKVQERVAKLDEEAINLIRASQHQELLNYLDEQLIPLPGAPAIGLLLKTINFTDSRLEQYYTSAAMNGKEKQSISYASIVFY